MSQMTPGGSMRGTFILMQPRSPWGLHPYLPNGLLAVASRLQAVGIEWCLIDENIGQTVDDIGFGFAEAGAVGIGCLGSPYVSETLRVGSCVRRRGYDGPILIGGEFVKRLTPEQFDCIFGSLKPVLPAGDEAALDAFVGQSMPSIFDLSMGAVIRGLPPPMMQSYFGKEWCLFTSQGCIYTCNFCAATKGQKERFRSPEAFADEADALAFAVHTATGGRPQYEVYCSTLDGFQSPQKMEQMLDTLQRAMRAHGVELKLRFLATAKCTVAAERRYPGIIGRFRKLGVGCVGIGVDGDDAATWRRENKAHNDHTVVAEALELLSTNDVQPEAFMVIGLPGDSPRAMLRGGVASVRFALNGIRPRPYLGKSGVPGSKAWEEGGETVERLLANPRLFREFEYAGLGSPVTHPDARQRRLANAVFLATCAVLKLTTVGCPTQPLLPSESSRWPLRLIAPVWNRLMPQDR